MFSLFSSLRSRRFLHNSFTWACISLALATGGNLSAQAPNSPFVKTAVNPSVARTRTPANYNPAPNRSPERSTIPTSGRDLAPGFDVPLDDQPPISREFPSNSAGESRSTRDQLMAEIEARYHDPLTLRFLDRFDMNRALYMYREISQLIDSRHVGPVSYEVRTAHALDEVALALESPAFLRAAGVNASSTSSLAAELRRLAAQPVRNSEDAAGVMQWASDLASKRLGIPKHLVAYEFIHGSIDSLDKFSSFVPSKTAGQPRAALEEQIVGIGVELKSNSQGALILGTISGGPAERAGLKKGDLIVAINGNSLAGLTLGEMADQIAGREGTTVRLKVRRGDLEGTVNVPRRSLYVSSVGDARMLNDSVAYIRIKQFSESTTKDVQDSLFKLYKQGMKGLILDLRGNPGGLLNQAIDLSNLFLPRGVIVSTRGRNPEDNSQEVASFNRTWKTPLVILVDGNSASASEIFAAAIQENGRGLVVGRKTYGKGTVQTHFPMQTVSGELKLTTAKFYSPSGREMAGAGVTPNILVRSSSEWEASLDQDPDVVAGMRAVRSTEAIDLANGLGNSRSPYRPVGLGN